jgi:hypothetical protein
MSISDLFFPNNYNLYCDNLTTAGSLNVPGTINVSAISTCSNPSGNIQTEFLTSCGSGTGPLTITADPLTLSGNGLVITSPMVRKVPQALLLNGGLFPASDVYFQGIVYGDGTVNGGVYYFDTAPNIFAILAADNITPFVGMTFNFSMKNTGSANISWQPSLTDATVSIANGTGVSVGPGLIPPAASIITLQVVSISSTPNIQVY